MATGRWIVLLVCVVLGAALVGPASAQSVTWVPNDLLFSEQWNLTEPGTTVTLTQMGGGSFVSQYGINVPNAWGYFWEEAAGNWWRVPGEGVTVAIIGDGFYTNHEDLAGTSIVPGYDFTSKKANPYPAGHHTGEAGLIAATADNGTGVAGIAFGASLMSIKVAITPADLIVANGAGSPSPSQLATAIKFAADRGAKVILVAAEYPYEMKLSTLLSAVTYAYNKGATIVAPTPGAGWISGDGQGNCYPGGFDGQVIAVGSVTADGDWPIAEQSTPHLDLVAPAPEPGDDFSGDGIGLWLLSNGPGGYYVSGHRSRAAAQVAGVAALVRSAHPDWTRDQVRAALESTATDLGDPGRDDVYGNGLVDAYAALTYAP